MLLDTVWRLNNARSCGVHRRGDEGRFPQDGFLYVMSAFTIIRHQRHTFCCVRALLSRLYLLTSFTRASWVFFKSLMAFVICIFSSRSTAQRGSSAKRLALSRERETERALERGVSMPALETYLISAIFSFKSFIFSTVCSRSSCADAESSRSFFTKGSRSSANLMKLMIAERICRVRSDSGKTRSRIVKSWQRAARAIRWLYKLVR